MKMITAIKNITLHKEGGVGIGVTFDGFRHNDSQWTFRREEEPPSHSPEACVFYIFFDSSAGVSVKEHYFRQIASTNNYALCMYKGNHSHTTQDTAIFMML